MENQNAGLEKRKRELEDSLRVVKKEEAKETKIEKNL
jgi:hypothetical protein